MSTLQRFTSSECFVVITNVIIMITRLLIYIHMCCLLLSIELSVRYQIVRLMYVIND